MKGTYENLDHYLDVQFRLLREDFVGPLRDGISNYMQVVAERGKTKKLQDVRIYHSVALITPICGDSGICHQLQFDVSRMRNVRWRSTKRLIYGSLVCLSPDNFQTFYFATVKDRKPELLQKGLVTVRFEHAHTEIKTLFGTLFTMAETTAYFESYKHVLAGLKSFHDGDLPFEKYIIACESQVQPPGYLRRDPSTTFDLRPLVDEDTVLHSESRLEHLGDDVEALVARLHGIVFTKGSKPAEKVEVLDRESWPPADLLNLDESQFKAIHTALTKEFVITQGPPGTGKTYIGLKIVKALLHNKKIWSKHPDTGVDDPKPMLIVCYTNHALDQFLEGVVKYHKGGVLRVGSRSNSEVLKDYNLHNFRQRFRHAQKVPVAVYQGRRNAKHEMDSRYMGINKISMTIQHARTNILHEDYLQPFMGKHYQMLNYQLQQMLMYYPEAMAMVSQKGFSAIVEWLGLGNLAPVVEIEQNAAPENPPQENIDDDMIDVEEEVDFIQDQRKLDGSDDDDDDDDMEDGLEDVVYMNREAMKEQVERHARAGRKAVALDVEAMEQKPKNVEMGEWQTQKKQRKKMKRKTQRNLCNMEIMTDDEADRTHDLLRMAIVDKWRLYRLWTKRYCDYYLTQIDEKQDEYEAAAIRYKEALLQEDKEIMKCSTVIGMTTTGAARYQAILQEIKPRIIVVEEAAEVLEAHIITVLSRGCEQVILIGDHKQLRPNPTVYKLATDYNLDVSLFERMVKNGFKCDCLELQHRMRPEIAQLMLHIYDNYKNHEDVEKYDSIKGVSTNICFINHNQPETHDNDLRSHSNYFEAEYAVALCRYLMQQGYQPEQITVLTTYSGQLFQLRNLMPKTEFEGVKVTVVDNYQGEENDIVILSLVRSNEGGNIGFLKIDNRVCVALSRAKKGFYVIGNFDMLSECKKSALWTELVSDMRKKKLVGDGLLLYCQNHPDDGGILAKCKKDFDKAPEGGCNKKCDFRLQCGHACNMFCHVTDQEHNDYLCKKTCNKVTCANGHRCKLKCHQKCGDCKTLLEKRIPKCGHKQQVPCYQKPEDFTCQENCQAVLSCGHRCQSLCGMAHTSKCMASVEKTWPCGFTGKIRCYQRDDAPCPKPCGDILECEHRCQGTCGGCSEGLLHRPCKNDCNRILVCGHACTALCNQCPPCTRLCENRCVHSKCKQPCGELCQPCMEPCTWRCEHYKCNNLCSEPCDRPRCNEPCKKRLDCGHPCIGLCGEPCPEDCRVCDAEKVSEVLFGDEDEPDARFVLLKDCPAKCIIESKAMDQYMDNAQDQGEEIQLRKCPMCNTKIRKSVRYGSIINKSLQDIEDVKRKILGNKQTITVLEEEIKTILEERTHEPTKLVFTRRLKEMPKPRTATGLTAVKNQLEIVRRIKKRETEWKKLTEVTIQQQKEKMLKFFKQFRDWAMTERAVMTKQEIEDAECELLRSEHKLKLHLHEKRLKERKGDVDTKLKDQFRKLEQILNSGKKYKGKERDVVELCLKELKKIAPLTGIGISEEERKNIVQAMELPSGHWFKCPNGKFWPLSNINRYFTQLK